MSKVYWRGKKNLNMLIFLCIFGKYLPPLDGRYRLFCWNILMKWSLILMTLQKNNLVERFKKHFKLLQCKRNIPWDQWLCCGHFCRHDNGSGRILTNFTHSLLVTCHLCYWVIVFEAGASQGALAGLEFTVLIRLTLYWQWLFLVLPPRGWDCRCTVPCPALIFVFR